MPLLLPLLEVPLLLLLLPLLLLLLVDDLAVAPMVPIEARAALWL